MTPLVVRTLGAFQAQHNGTVISGFESDKVRLLLVYLLIEADQPHRREKLAGLFWPERSDSDARTNLRRALFNLRRALPTPSGDTPYFQITRQTIQDNPQADIWFDVREFTAVTTHSTASIEQLARAADLFRDEFLCGMSASFSLALEEWLLLQREQLARQLVWVLEKLTTAYMHQGSYQQALPYARRRVKLEPWQEQGHRLLMRLLAASGQVRAAQAQFTTCRDLLQTTLGVAPEKETVALYEQICQQAAGGGDTAVPTANLPAPLTPLVGRRTELAAITDYFAKQRGRLLTLVGSGGVGKTRLALAAAAACQGQHRHGVFFVPLAALTKPADILSAVAQTIGALVPGGTNQNVRLYDFLRDKQILLVLDNFEHLLDGAAIVNDLLQAAPQLTILATSRARLNLPDEQSLPLDGLDLQSSALQLFQQGARRVNPQFTLNDDNLPTVVTICRCVNGLPLGLLLAASWVHTLTLAEIATELDHSLDLLAVEWQGIPERHRSIRAVIRHSWDLLTATDQQTLSSLSIFSGGFTREMARDVADASLPQLRRFVIHSLLTHGSGRYFLHDLLRHFAREQLAAQPERQQAVQRRHADTFCRAAQQWEAQLRGPQQQTALSHLLAERDNVHSAWLWAADHGDSDNLWRALDGLCRLHEWQVQYQDGWEMTAAALAGLDGAAVPFLALRLLVWQAFFGWRLGRKAEARALLVKGLAIVQQMATMEQPHDEEQGRLAYMQGRLLESHDRHAARIHYQRSLAAFQRSGSDWYCAMLYGALGSVAWNLGEYAAAAAAHQQALAIRRRLQDTHGVAQAAMVLGLTRLYQGDFVQAEALVAEGSALRRHFGDRLGIADSVRALGITRMALGKFDESADLLRESVQMYTDLGLRYGLEMALLAAALLHSGEWDEAERWGERGLAIARDTGYQRALGYGLLVRGMVALVQQHPSAAGDALAESLTIYRALQQRDEIVQVLAMQGAAWLALGQVNEAAGAVAAALDLVQVCQAAVSLLCLLPVQVAVWQALENNTAVDRLIPILASYPFITQSRFFRLLLPKLLFPAPAPLTAPKAADLWAMLDRGKT